MTPRYTPGKMLQQYSVRLQIYSWFMKYCHPKLASAGVIAGDVGRCQQAFLALLPGKAQCEIYRQSCEQNQVGIRLLNKLTWLCFLVFVDMKTG